MINISSTTFQVQRRRFPLKPRSVRTPPAKFRWVPETEGEFRYSATFGFLVWKDGQPARNVPTRLSPKLRP